MPTYEYQCLKCRKTFERLQRMTEAALTRCPRCKGKVERLISAGTGLIFKGSGFYITDYKKRPIPSKVEEPKAACLPDSQGSAKQEAGSRKSEGSKSKLKTDKHE